jgi:hypothetical protein
MKPRSNMSAHFVAIASKTKMRPSVIRIVYMLGDIAGRAQHFSCWALTGLSMRALIDPAKLTHVAIVVRSSGAAAELHGRGIQLSVTGTKD